MPLPDPAQTPMVGGSTIRSVPKPNYGYLVSALLLSCVVFTLDLMTSLGVATGAGYIAPILLASIGNRADVVWWGAAIATVLILVGMMFSPSGSAVTQFAVNRTLSIGLVWIVALSAVVRIASQTTAETTQEVTCNIIDSALDAVVGIDAEGRILHWNPQAEITFGWTAEQAVGREFSELAIPEQYQARFRERFHKFVASDLMHPRDQRIRMTGVRRNSELFLLELTGFATKQNSRAEFAAFIRDLSEQQSYEERLELLLQSTGEGLYGLDLQGNCTFCNPSCLELLGYESVDELLGCNMHDKIHHSHEDGSTYAEKDCRIYRALRRHERMHVDDEVFWRADGTSFPVEYWSYPMLRDGQLVGAVVTFVDITHRRTVEKRIREVVDFAPNGFVMIDSGGLLTLVNVAAEKLFEYSRDDLIGRPATLLFPERFHGQVSRWPDALNHPTTADSSGIDLYGLRQSGEEFPVEVSCNALQTDDGGFILTSIVNTTERQLAAARLEEANVELKARSEEMEQFAYTVSHDLKSPLVTIGGFLGMIQEDLADGDTESVTESIHRVQRATRHMGRLLDDLLELSRAGSMRTDPQLVDVKSLVLETLDEYSARIAERGAELEVRDNIPSVMADRVRMTQVFGNLISNAIKYGLVGEAPRIEIGGSRRGHFVRFYIRDNGPGIDRSEQDRIFRVFHRLQSDQDGTGLGLAVVKRIVQRHGGRVWVESEPEQGSTFFVELPDLPRVDSISGDQRFKLQTEPSAEV